MQSFRIGLPLRMASGGLSCWARSFYCPSLQAATSSGLRYRTECCGDPSAEAKGKAWLILPVRGLARLPDGRCAKDRVDAPVASRVHLDRRPEVSVIPKYDCGHRPALDAPALGLWREVRVGRATCRTGSSQRVAGGVGRCRPLRGQFRLVPSASLPSRSRTRSRRVWSPRLCPQTVGGH